MYSRCVYLRIIACNATNNLDGLVFLKSNLSHFNHIRLARNKTQTYSDEKKNCRVLEKKQLVVPISDHVYTIENQKSIRSQKGTELVHGFREKGAQFSIPSIDVLDFADNGSAHQTVTSHHTKL